MDVASPHMSIKSRTDLIGVGALLAGSTTRSSSVRVKPVSTNVRFLDSVTVDILDAMLKKHDRGAVNSNTNVATAITMVLGVTKKYV